jgi:hypothetical protein
MGRPKRSALSGWVHHVLNRANARMPIFTKDEDFIAFEVWNQTKIVHRETAAGRVMWVSINDRLGPFHGSDLVSTQTPGSSLGLRAFAASAAGCIVRLGNIRGNVSTIRHNEAFDTINSGTS